MKFKVRFPTPNQIIDVYDDNLDINIILENDGVYFGTLFTLTNIDKLMKKNREVFFLVYRHAYCKRALLSGDSCSAPSCIK